jgi:hypothetical protein
MLFAFVCNINIPDKRVIRSDKQITSVYPGKSPNGDIGAEPSFQTPKHLFLKENIRVYFKFRSKLAFGT